MKVIRYVGNADSLAPKYRAALNVRKNLIIDTSQETGNVTVRFELDGKPVQVNFPDKARDLLDLGAAVYIADEIAERSRAGGGWTRSFRFIFPVKHPEDWSRATQAFRAALGTLSGDQVELSWITRGPLPRLKRRRRKLSPRFDAICLFSGGADSFLGAHQFLSEGKRLLLVGHQADGITAAAQAELAGVLRARFPGAVSLLQVRIARSLAERPLYRLPKKVEKSHRVRSFLFLSIAASVAASLRVSEIIIPENGFIALNPPIQLSRLGTLSTRTAHPLFLMHFADAVSEVGIFGGRIHNPFLYQSKTDILRNLDPGLAESVQRTVSCGHAGSVRWTGRRVRHCGYCVPCIHRRIAFLEAGIDRARDYAFDVFRSLSRMTGRTQSDFRALTRFAYRVETMTQTQRAMLPLGHGSFPPEVGARFGPMPAADHGLWADMVLRWAQDFLAKVERMGTSTTKRILGVARGPRARVS